MIRIVSIFLASVFCVGCASFFYYPTHQTYFDPEKYFGLKPQDIFLNLDPETTLHAWYFQTESKKPKGTFIQFHGNAENLTSHYAMLAWVIRAEYNLLIFDYPGYGKSTGKPSPKTTVRAGVAFLDWTQKNSPMPHIVYGNSLGGIIALRSIEEMKNSFKPEAIIIDASFDSYTSIARRKLASWWLTWPLQWLSYLVLSDRWAPKDIKALSPTPILFIHGKKDRVIPYDFSERMFNKAGDPKALWLIEEGLHGNTFSVSGGLYQKHLLDYLNINTKK